MTFDKRRDLLTFHHNEHPKDDMKFLEQTYDELKTLATNKAARRAFNLQRNHALKYSTSVELLDTAGIYPTISREIELSASKA